MLTAIIFVLAITAWLTGLVMGIINKLGVILATEQELNDKLDAIATIVANVAADVADLKSLLEAAEGIPQEIMDKASAIADALSAVDAEHSLL